MSYSDPPDPHLGPGQQFPRGFPQHGPTPEGPIDPYTAPQTGGWQPMGAPGPPAFDATGTSGPPVPAQPIAVIGDMTITNTQVITPNGTFLLRGSMWTLNDMTHVQRHIPTWAIVLAIVGFFFVCLFSLLLLIVKETEVRGSIQISVRSTEHYHTTMLPVHSLVQARHLHDQFNYVRAMAMA